MTDMLVQLRRSATAKVFVIAALILALLIPMSMIRGVINERQGLYDEAKRGIMDAWGRPQTLGAPILVVPFESMVSTGRGATLQQQQAHALPALLRIEGALETEIRYRGIHEVPVYVADLKLRGRFDDVDFSALGVDVRSLKWSEAFLALPLSDARPLKGALSLQVGDATAAFAPGGVRVEGFEPQIVVPLSELNLVPGENGALSGFDFSLDLRIGGTDRVRFLPMGDVTEVRLSSGWPSPSFAGAHVADQRTVNDQGFEAEWRVLHLGRGYPSKWLGGQLAAAPVWTSAFGVDLLQPVGTYQTATRAAKYAVLFIGMSFVVFFLFEVLGRLRLHPLQYLLVGFANCIFYLLLLALSEHVSFGWAYLLSTAGSVAAVGGYSSAVLAGSRRGLAISAALVAMYGFLYLTLREEDYAMLAGSLGLFGVLVTLMYVTRHIDWYRIAPPTNPAETQG